MTDIERIQNTPVYRLTAAEIRLLPDEDQKRALSILFDMARNGDMVMVSENPPGTTYEVVWDGNHGWKLSPICSCGAERRFVDAYTEYHS